MTNDKTVTMSRELAEQFLAGGRQCDRDQLRAILDARSVPVDAEQWYADTPDGDSALVTRVAALCNHPSMSFHQVALLEGAISESAAAAPVVERQKPVALPARSFVGDIRNPYRHTVLHDGYISGWNAYQDAMVKLGPLYTSPPAPVAVVHPGLGSTPEHHMRWLLDKVVNPGDYPQAVLHEQIRSTLACINKVKELNQ